MRRGILKRLRGDRRGVTVIEFAIVAPVMLLLMMGLGDVLYGLYLQSILQGAVQKAARDSTIEGAADNAATIDGRVVAMVGKLVKNMAQNCSADAAAPSWCALRENYDKFTEVGPEPLDDTNHNGVRDAGECFVDTNGNGVWDQDPGATGQGGANDVTLYTMRIRYPHVFPVARLLGWTGPMEIKATTLLKNQPYATQSDQTNVRICS
jgi:hypothetical protein